MSTKLLLGALAALMLIGGGLFALARQQKGDPQPIACTMEAKLCPDGSAVGRTGPNCEFAACPETPATNTPPLPDTAAILPYGDVTLRAGETAAFPDNSVTFLRVTSDSRCAEGVTCIWAGTLTAEFRVVSQSGATTETVELGKSVTKEGITLSLLSAIPYTKINTTITSDDYRLTIRVKKATAGTIVPPAPKPIAGKCFVGGCSGEVCSDREDLVSICIYREEFACYKKAACERQQDGACGWTTTAELEACLANPSGI